jgi:hypothetical protein
MYRLVVCSVAALALSGCMLDRETRMARHQSACNTYGFVAGTPAFAQCMQTEENQWQARHEAGLQQLRQQNMQQQMLNQQRMNSGTNCISQPVGNTIQTTCY